MGIFGIVLMLLAGVNQHHGFCSYTLNVFSIINGSIITNGAVAMNRFPPAARHDEQT